MAEKPLTEKTPVTKLGAVMATISDVQKPWGLAVNRSGELIIAEEETSQLLVYNKAGDKLRTLNIQQDTVAGGYKSLRGVAVDSEDNILVVDAGNYQLLKLSQGGDLIAAVGSEGYGPGQFKGPVGVCINGVNGKVYVVDRKINQVSIFNSNLTFSSKFGCWGKKDGQFETPWDIDSDSTGCVYVADAGNHRVQVFTSDGEYLRKFGWKGMEKGGMCFPVSICVDSDGLVYVGECISKRVSVFTGEGKFLHLFGSWGSEPGQFCGPYGITVCEGAVCVGDHGISRIQLF